MLKILESIEKEEHLDNKKGWVQFHQTYRDTYAADANKNPKENSINYH